MEQKKKAALLAARDAEESITRKHFEAALERVIGNFCIHLSKVIHFSSIFVYFNFLTKKKNKLAQKKRIAQYRCKIVKL